MADFKQNDNSGALFRNDRKESDKQPDYKGTATINGVKLEIAAWIKESNSGTKFMSLRFQEPRVRTESAEVKPPAEDIPF